MPTRCGRPCYVASHSPPVPFKSTIDIPEATDLTNSACATRSQPDGKGRQGRRKPGKNDPEAPPTLSIPCHRLLAFRIPKESGLPRTYAARQGEPWNCGQLCGQLWFWNGTSASYIS
ncbi:hypothetical protein EJ06DRAFT_318299 [Trichodelitschia bisporula]|uniref:Uncharacterized protein n=1 Tax=Trichodelitschia bisporula TaxID=703511 RepID=A0A6G1I440_9PEZI|nr:hypothetical protein EJ06DRAFT_318299 [Trichodelitschia bisporula]